MLGTLLRVIRSDRQGLGTVMFEMGRMVAESVMLIEREEIAGPDYYPSEPVLQKWGHDEGSIYLGDQKVKGIRPRGYGTWSRRRGPFSPLPGCAPPGRSLRNCWRRSYTACRPSRMPRPSSRRSRPWGCRPLQNCEALFSDLERCGLALSRRILFVTDGGSGLLKALRERFEKKLVHRRCVIHRSRNLQRYLAKPYPHKAHRKLATALEQTHDAEAEQMLLELEAWLRKTLRSTTPIECLCSLVRHRERTSIRTRGSALLQRLLYCEQPCKRVQGCAGIAQVIVTIEAEYVEQLSAPTKKAA